MRVHHEDLSRHGTFVNGQPALKTGRGTPLRFGDQIKVGSITRSERLAKYNRLLAIERETRLPVNPWPGNGLA